MPAKEKVFFFKVLAFLLVLVKFVLLVTDVIILAPIHLRRIFDIKMKDRKFRTKYIATFSDLGWN